MFKKITKADVGYNLDGLEGEQKKFMENVLGMIVETVNKSLDGALSEEDVTTKFAEINKSLEGVVNGEEYKKHNEEILSQLKSLGETVEKLTQKGLTPESISKFDEAVNNMLDSEKFQDFVKGDIRKSGSFEGFSLKDMSMGANYTGDLLVTQQQDRVVTHVANKRVHARDVITTLNGDPLYPQLAFAQIYDLDRNARFVSENGTLPESSFKIKEETASTKRLGTHVRISKRMLKSRVYVRSFILNKLPEAILNAEDFQILFGDGTGENLLGIVNYKGVQSVESIISTSVLSGTAGSVSAIETYNSGKDTLVTFTDAHDLMLDGMMITFKGATDNSGYYNKTFPVIKLNDRQILLQGVEFKSESSVSSMTFTVNHAAFKSVPEPNSGDAIKTAFAVMSYAEYNANVIVMNPITVNAIECEKDTTGHSLGLITNENGAKRIAGYPIVETPSVPAGMYFIGDFNNGANLVDYTSLELEWAEDVDSKLKNQVVLIAQEEVILPVYNPWAFAYGKISALKTAITAD